MALLDRRLIEIGKKLASGKCTGASGGVVYENGAKAGYSANVTSLVYEDGVIYQENSADDWWSWNGSGWVGTSTRNRFDHV